MNRYEALKHAVKAHAGQVDKCGQPYILHPIAVAEAVEGADVLNNSPHIVVALLHDVLEDTAYVLPADGLGPYEYGALLALTRQTDREPFPEPYAQYIERVCENEIACFVKLADLWHNMLDSRLVWLPVKEQISLERRYLDARQRIWDALGFDWWPEDPAGIKEAAG